MQIVSVDTEAAHVSCDRHPSARAKVRITLTSGFLYFCGHCAHEFGFVPLDKVV